MAQVMEAYNSRQHSTVGIRSHKIMTGHEKALSFLNPEYEGKKTSP